MQGGPTMEQLIQIRNQQFQMEVTKHRDNLL